MASAWRCAASNSARRRGQPLFQEITTRVAQPRLRHRYQVDRHGLAVSRHRLRGEGENVTFDLHAQGSGLAQVLGAIYAVERLDLEARRVLVPVLHRAMRWRGPIGPAFIANLAGSASTSLSALADPRAWALEVLGFPPGTGKVTKKDVSARFRDELRRVHPDHGADLVAVDVDVADLRRMRQRQGA